MAFTSRGPSYTRESRWLSPRGGSPHEVLSTQDGWAKVQAGLTTVEEVLRVLQ
jgi:hypothetical protein